MLQPNEPKVDKLHSIRALIILLDQNKHGGHALCECMQFNMYFKKQKREIQDGQDITVTLTIDL